MFAIAKGFVIGLSMIIPIGAQNAYVLNQSIKQNFHFTAASICILCDLLLMGFGIFGGGVLIQSLPNFATVISWGGVVFLVTYAALSLKAAFSEVAQLQTQSVIGSRKIVIATTLAVTLLNPHVYLDTIMIIGNIGSQFNQHNEKLLFWAGTVSASIVWFLTLSSAAAKSARWLAMPIIQKAINILVAIIMLMVAYSLIP